MISIINIIIKTNSLLRETTNKNYKLVVGRDTYVVRLPDKGTDEYIGTRLVNHIGIDSKLIYFKDENVIKTTQYIESIEIMNRGSVKNMGNMQIIARIFYERIGNNFRDHSNIGLRGNWVLLIEPYKYNTISNTIISYYMAYIYSNIMWNIIRRGYDGDSDTWWYYDTRVCIIK